MIQGSRAKFQDQNLRTRLVYLQVDGPFVPLNTLLIECTSGSLTCMGQQNAPGLPILSTTDLGLCSACAL
jgi:hypothetical protein